MNIEITGLTKPQEIALEDLFAKWVSLGNVGASRWTAFYADGDGNFRPKILINGKKPKPQEIVDSKSFNRRVEVGKERYENRFDSDYAIDFDTIAWALSERL